LFRSSERFQRGYVDCVGRGERFHFVALLLGIERSSIDRMRNAVVPWARARNESLFEVLMFIRGDTAITSLMRGERRAVSIAHRESASLGGSIKRHEERSS